MFDFRFVLVFFHSFSGKTTGAIVVTLNIDSNMFNLFSYPFFGMCWGVLGVILEVFEGIWGGAQGSTIRKNPRKPTY